MPYFITDRHPECDNFAVVKEDGELVACHGSEQEAIDQMVAVSIAEDLEPGGTYEGDQFRARISTDIYTTEQEALDRAEALGCSGAHSMDQDGRTVYMPCSTHAAYERVTGTTDTAYNRDEPAPPEDQIEGSDENEPGSASGAGGDIELSERTETALRNKVQEHNEAMEEADKPAWTRTTYGQLSAVYRRGAGAYSQSHRPGVSRGAWAMARVNAYLYLLRNGRPQNAAYITDNDLLPEDHPKSTRSGDAEETRQVNLDPPAYMRAAARRGLEFYEEGLGGDGLVDRTIREARAMARGNVTAEKWVRIAAWISRHLDDLDAPAADPDNDDYPSPGVVAHLLWGSGPSKRAARRSLAYAEGVVARLEAENEGRAKGESLKKLETRTANVTDCEVRETQDGMTFEGYAAVFESASEPLPFTEKIAPGAFSRSLKTRNEVKLLWNHDTGSILGSKRAGTLKMIEDDRGLRVSAALPNTQLGRDTAELLRRGDVDAMSFGFSVPKNGDDWSEDGSERTLREIRLHEVSIVAFPAYGATAGTTTVRALDRVAQRANVDVDALADALLKLENGQDMDSADREMLESVLNELSPEPAAEPEPEPDTDDKALLELKKKKLAILKGMSLAETQ